MAHILVVDDDGDLRALLKTALERDGHQVSLLDRGGAVSEAHCRWADCILLDVMMPGEDGFATCRRIRALAACPILFLTAKTEEADVLTGLGLGGDDYLSKPFRIAELRARVAGLAGTPARRRRLRPWMGVCACLAVLLLGGTLLLPRLGGSSAGGGGHAGGSIFQSYAGPVFPLTTLEDAGLTARRTITLDFAPWGDGHTTDIDVTDSYVLTNPTDTDQSVTLVYPFSGSFYALYPPPLTADGAALDAVIRPGVGGSQSLESWDDFTITHHERFPASGERHVGKDVAFFFYCVMQACVLGQRAAAQQ